MKPITAYHFLVLGGRMRHPVDGHTHVTKGLSLHEDKIKLCVRGLHASIEPLDALQYAPGPCLTLVECSGDVLCEDDKIVCTDRKVIAGPVDVTDIIVRFAQWCADRANATAAAAAAACDATFWAARDAADAAAAATRAANATRAAAYTAAYAAAANAAAASARSDVYATNVTKAAADAAAYGATATAYGVACAAAAARAAAVATNVAKAAAAAAAYDATAAKARPRRRRASKRGTDERKTQNSWLRVEFAKALKAGGEP